MAPMSSEQFRKAKLKMRDRLARLILWKLGEMHEKYVARPRTQRPDKDLRAAAATEERGPARPDAGRSPRGTPSPRSRSSPGRGT